MSALMNCSHSSCSFNFVVICSPQLGSSTRVLRESCSLSEFACEPCGTLRAVPRVSKRASQMDSVLLAISHRSEVTQSSCGWSRWTLSLLDVPRLIPWIDMSYRYAIVEIVDDVPMVGLAPSREVGARVKVECVYIYVGEVNLVNAGVIDSRANSFY